MFIVLECVNGDYGNFNDVLAIASKNTRWCQNSEDTIQTLKWSKMIETTSRKSITPSITPPMQSTQHVYPPQEFVKLWILIGRCHVQFFRDWVRIYST